MVWQCKYDLNIVPVAVPVVIPVVVQTLAVNSLCYKEVIFNAQSRAEAPHTRIEATASHLRELWNLHSLTRPTSLGGSMVLPSMSGSF